MHCNTCALCFNVNTAFTNTHVWRGGGGGGSAKTGSFYASPGCGSWAPGSLSTGPGLVEESEGLKGPHCYQERSLDLVAAGTGLDDLQ